MSIQMIGIDHGTAGIDIRTVFSVTKRTMEELLAQVKQMPGVEGCVMISTCNRMELWISTDTDRNAGLYEAYCGFRGVSPDEYRRYFQFRWEREAAEHLFRLAAGLESRILGEDQIITQVKDALSFAREHEMTDPVLETLFRLAVTAAKKVKASNISFSGANQSVVHVALAQLKHMGYSFSGKTCMVIGNGVMGKLAATLLQQEGADVTVTVRQYRSGVVEIPENCKRIDYGSRMELIGSCDFVFSATVSPNCTVTKEQLEEHMGKRLVLVDLAVPRDIDPETAKLPGVVLFDLDSFQEKAGSREQQEAVRRADECLKEQLEEFFVWYEYRDMMPKIQKIKEKFAQDLSARLTKKLRGISVSGEEQEMLLSEIEGAAQRSVNKLLFGLRDGAGRDAFRESLSVLEQIYTD